MKLVYSLVGVAALLFIVGGVGTIAAFVGHWEPGTRTAFMYVFLAGLVPTVALLMLALLIGIWHMYVTRVQKRYPVGWVATNDDAPTDY